MTNEQYQRLVKKHAAPSPILLNCVKAFSVGGVICAIGQVLLYIYMWAGAEKTTAFTLVSVTLVGASVILTALDIYDSIAKFGGAGTLVPITGFANSVVAPAIDNKAEGLILGLGAKLFTISGPVILYGTLASVIYGIFYFLKTAVM